MFRRIELINHFPQKDGSTKSFIHGLCGISTELVADAWCGLHIPRKRINKNGRFYFTELGWDVYGRDVVAACIQSEQEYKVIAIEEHDCSVIYKDEYQVVIHPKRKGR
jgi:hypothetical protein